MQFKADVLHAVAAEVFDLQHDFLARGIVLDGIVFRELAPDHQLNEALLVRVPDIQRVDVLAVPQDGNAVADLEQLIQTVRDVDDSDALLLQVTDDIKQPPLFLDGDGSRRLVQNQDAGIAENGLADLDDLAVGHGQLTDPGFGRDVALELFQQLGGFSAALGIVDEEAGVAAAGHEKIVRYGHGLELDHLLIDDRDAELQRFLGGQMVIGDAVKENLAAVGLHGARDGFDKGRFAGSILADQCMNFALTKADGNVVQCDNTGIAFGDVV